MLLLSVFATSSWNDADVGKIGKVGVLEEVEEYRVEAICLGRDTAVDAVAALRK